MGLKSLFIFPDFKKNISSGMQQRIFVEALDRVFFNNLVLCDNGDIDTSGIAKTFGVHTIPIRFAQLVLITLFPNKAFSHDLDSLKKKRLIKEAKEIIISESVNYIHSCSLPCLSHHVGLHLKKTIGLPWVAQFYDPWYGNPERQFITSIFKKKDRTLEAEIAHHADVIIHSNPVIYNTWIERYGREIANKMEILPLSIPISRIKKAELRKKKTTLKNNGYLVISHIGSLSQIRPINTLTDGVKRFLEGHPEKKKFLRLQFVGHVSRENKSIISDAGLDYCTTYIRHQPSYELEKFYEQTDILLLMDANIIPNIYFPSKLPDYLSQKKPVLCVTSNDSISYNYLHKAGHFCFKYGDVEGVANYINMAFENYDALTKFDEDCYKFFSPEVINAKYKEIITKHIKKKE